MTELLAELAADADVVLEHDAIAEAARQRIRAKLPQALEAGAGAAELERTIKSIYVARTITRWNAGSDAAKPPSRRKRAGAGPSAS